MQPRIPDGVAEQPDLREVAVLLLADLGVTGQEIRDGTLVELMPREVVRIHAILVLRPLRFEPDDLTFRQFLRRSVHRRVGPDLQREISGRVREDHFEVGLAALSAADGAGLELGLDRGVDGDFPGLFLDGGNGDRAHAGDHGRRRRAVTFRAIATVAVPAYFPDSRTKWMSPSTVQWDSTGCRSDDFPRMR